MLPFAPTKIPPPQHVCSRARESQCHVDSAHGKGGKAHGIVVLDGGVLDVRVRVAADVERGALGVRRVGAVSSVHTHKQLVQEGGRLTNVARRFSMVQLIARTVAPWPTSIAEPLPPEKRTPRIVTVTLPLMLMLPV